MAYTPTPVADLPTVKPSDVQPWSETPATYATGSTLNVRGDGSDFRGGVMPIIASQPDDVPTTTTEWLVSNSEWVDRSDYTTGEAKSRFSADHNRFAADDPLLKFGQPGESHLHDFFGGTSINAWTTYESGRRMANRLAQKGLLASSAAGGPYNGSGYWVPAMLTRDPFGDGFDYANPISHTVIYYASNGAQRSEASSRIPRGLRYITGRNMFDPDDILITQEIDAANAAAGNNRYGYPGNGFNGWSLYTVSDVDGTTTIERDDPNESHDFFVRPDGTDPWATNGPDGPHFIKAGLTAPQSYNGIDLWAPDGRSHMRHIVSDSQDTTPYITGSTAPNGWFWQPKLTLTVWWYFESRAQRLASRLSSDDHVDMMTGRQNGAGWSMHADWFGLWDDKIFFGSEDGTELGWQRFCTNVSGDGAKECNSSTINSTHLLLGGYANTPPPPGSSPLYGRQYVQASKTERAFTPEAMFKIPPNGGKGPFTLGT